jgi:myo-inositol-1(or 4)-monophosphatase
MTTQRELKQVMFEAGELAAGILLKHFGRIRTVDKKSDVDVVTEADRKSERAVMKRIRQAFPDHAILAEESGGTREPVEGYCWIIDPLDGTTNFAHGIPVFSVSIGLLLDGEPVQALVVDPTRGEWFYAKRGGGAFLNKRRIRVSGAKKLLDSLLLTGFPHDHRKNDRHFMDILEACLGKARGVLRLGSAALDLSYVASGRAEAFWEEHLSPWDVAAGLLLVQEAGGQCSPLDGSKSTVFDREVVASNGLIHTELRQVLRKAWQEW